MGTRTSYAPGTFCWVDLSTTDPDAAKGFYTELFGWDYDDREGEAGIYSIATLDGAGVAAINRQQPEEAAQGMPPHWNNYVSVEDASASLAKAREFGANVLGDAFQVEDAGKIGVLIDPAGAACLLWESGEHFGAGRVNEPGCLSWNELGTTDVEGATRFYGDLFGWRSEAMDTGGGSVYTVVSVGDRQNGGIREQSPEEREGGVPPNWMPYFVVPDSVDATLAKVGELGGATLFPPMDMPQGRIAVVGDPQGAAFALWEGPLDD